MDEMFPLVDDKGNVIGKAERSRCHNDNSLLHPVVHCMITNSTGEILLQLRSKNKKIQPGKWDTSVGGHVSAGEKIEQALQREVAEEIGINIEPGATKFLYIYIMRNEIESELVHTYTVTYDGPFTMQTEEIDELRFWSQNEITDKIGSGIFTPNFEDEFARFCNVERGA